jgi:hypothetical protein
MIIATAEHVIAISATLKTGKFGRPMKSTTEPNPGPGGRVSRSIKFPSNPPSNPPSARAHAREVIVRANRTRTTPTTTATMVNIQVYPAPIPHAAPVFSTYVKRRSGSMR